MNKETEKQKPNYALHYGAEFRDDWIDGEHCFNALNDGKACEIALSFVEEHNKKDRKEIDERRKSLQDWCYYIPLRLERIAYVIKEVEERTQISLEGDVTSRARSGAPIELTELINL